MKIRGKLTVAFVVVSVFLLAVGVAALVLIGRLNITLSNLAYYDLQVEQVATATHQLIDEPSRTAAHLARLQDLGKWSRTAEELNLVMEAKRALADDPTGGETLQALEELSRHYREASVAAHQQLLVYHHRAVIAVIVAMIEAVVLLVVLMALVRHWLLNPLLDLRETARRLAAGQWEQPVPATSPSTEFQELAASLNQLSTAVREVQEGTAKHERLATIGESCSHVAHTLRSPLQSIRSLADYERNATTVTPDSRAAFDHIIATVDAMDRWIRDLLNVMRPMELRPARQPLEPLVQNALSLLQAKSRDLDLQVEVEADEALPELALDRTLIEQALIAVLDNAMDASREKGQIDIRLAREPDGTVTIRVQDQGDGMDERTRERAWEAFYTTKPVAAGLGLHIARRITELHGGRMELESQPAQGTTVTFRLPATAA